MRLRRLLLAMAFVIGTGILAIPAFVAGETHRVDPYPVHIHFKDSQRRVADRIVEIVEQDLPILAGQLGLDPEMMARIDVELAQDVGTYERQWGIRLPSWGVAFAFSSRQLMLVDVQRATQAWNTLEKVIPHELSHLLLGQRVGAVAMPIWFVEGMAKWQAQEWSVVDSWQLMNSVWGGRSPKLWELATNYPRGEEPARAAYRVSYAAFTDLFDGRYDELPNFLSMLAESGDFDGAFYEFTGTEVQQFAVGFHENMERRYHSRLLVFQTGPLFSIVAVIFLFVGLKYYHYKRKKLKQMERLESGLSLDDEDGPVI